MSPGTILDCRTVTEIRKYHDIKPRLAKSYPRVCPYFATPDPAAPDTRTGQVPLGSCHWQFYPGNIPEGKELNPRRGGYGKREFDGWQHPRVIISERQSG